MSDLAKLYQAILLDPCNDGAERRNWSNIRDAFEEVEDIINNIIVEGDGGDTVITGDNLILFQCTATNIGSTSCPVKRMTWNGSVWQANGDDYVAYDWSTNGKYKMNFVEGHQGIGVLRTSVASDAVLVITLEGFARFCEITFNGPFSGSTASAEVENYWVHIQTSPTQGLRSLSTTWLTKEPTLKAATKGSRCSMSRIRSTCC